MTNDFLLSNYDMTAEEIIDTLAEAIGKALHDGNRRLADNLVSISNLVERELIGTLS